MALITVQEYKDYYNITNTSQNLIILNSINFAQSLAECFLSTNLKQTTYANETHDGGVSIIFLDNFPVTTISSVVEDGNVTTDYTAYKDEGKLVKGTNVRNTYGYDPTFAGGLQGVSISYTAGYTDTSGSNPLPDALRLALLKLTNFLINDRKSANPKLVRQTLHGEERQFGKLGPDIDVNLIPYDIRSILLDYR